MKVEMKEEERIIEEEFEKVDEAEEKIEEN
jgi:hypothetical protein